MNNVFGARLRITSLKSPHGSAIELLEYLTPRNGRPMPVDTKANDLWYWQIEVSTPNVDRIANQLQCAGHNDFGSSGIIQVPTTGSGFKRGLMARDPDGHALIFMAH